MNKYIAFLISANILLPAHFLPANEESRIFRGKEAREGEFPWMVFIRLSDELNCSGFIVSPSYIVTAAHCMNVSTLADMRGVVGTVEREKSTMLEFEQYLSHPEYSNKSFHADVALLKLKTSLEYTSLIQPICIGKKSSFFKEGNQVLQMGWGRERNDSAVVSRKLKVTDVGRLLSDSFCQSFLGRFNVTSEGRICLRNSEIEGVCEGDSGAPLVYKDSGEGYVAIGIVSFGFYVNCTVTNEMPEIYTNLGHYSDWITKNVEETVCIIE